MTLDQLNAALAKFPGATAEYPFGPGARVYKVGGKMFALVGETETPTTVSLKCDPDTAEELRASYPGTVIPGYHLNKRHWNTVTLSKAITDDELGDWLKHSYDLVFASLTRAARLEITASHSEK